MGQGDERGADNRFTMTVWVEDGRKVLYGPVNEDSIQAYVRSSCIGGRVLNRAIVGWRVDRAD